MRLILLCALVLIVSACANPINRVTYEDYKKQGAQAEAQGNWPAAEQAYYRAAENVRWGNLEPALQSNSLFDLGRAKRKVGKFDESESILKQALALDEKLYGVDAFLTSITISELAATYLEAKKYSEGIPLMIRLEPMLQQHTTKYSAQGRRFFKQLYEKYSVALANLPDAERFRSVAASL
jgi:tetratricopeptide (TPR) repeat protein